jgi:hypothetical protein
MKNTTSVVAIVKPLVLIATLWFSCATEARAQNGPQPTLRLDLSQAYQLPHYDAGTPILYHSAQDEIVLLQGHTDDRSDSLVSDDQGRTWRHWDAYSTWPKMIYQAVVPWNNELLAFGCYQGDGWDGTHVWWSNNNGLSWAGGTRVTQDAKNWAGMNSVIATSSGRLIQGMYQMVDGPEGPGSCQVGSIYSDDDGRSWTRSPIFGPPPPLPDRPEGFGEPQVIELTNGNIWMVFRTRFGTLWQAQSDDGGATWGTPSSTGLVSPLSNVVARKIPGTDAVVAIWNNVQPGTSQDWYDRPNLWYPRSPLVYAVSEDDCQTWSEPVVIDTGTATYPQVCFSDTEMFVTYWEDPDPNAFWMSANSHLMLVAYDLNAMHAPEPGPLFMAAMALLGVLAYARRK